MQHAQYVTCPLLTEWLFWALTNDSPAPHTCVATSQNHSLCTRPIAPTICICVFVHLGISAFMDFLFIVKQYLNNWYTNTLRPGRPYICRSLVNTVWGLILHFPGFGLPECILYLTLSFASHTLSGIAHISHYRDYQGSALLSSRGHIWI